tara:strand:- start:93961 stop:94929 length:969 start_codon:yes stop_codon:yes gene_type:complete
MARSRGIREVDVSGGGHIDDRGRHINTDIPQEARGKGSTGKSNAKKRLKQSQSKAKKRQDEIQEELDSEKPKKKKRAKKDREEDVNDLSAAVQKKKSKKTKTKPSKPKSKHAEEDGTPKKKKKKKKKTVGELLEEGKTEQARKKVNKLASKAVAISGDVEPVVEEAQPVSGHYVRSGGNSEADFLDEYHHIYGTLGSIIRKLEDRMTDGDAQVSSKDVYALMTMYSQMRETIADMRSIKDMNDQAEDLAQQVFDPAAKSSGEALVSLYFKVTTDIRQKVSDPSTVEELIATLKVDVADQASNLQQQFDIARSRIVDVLNGGR